MEKIIVKGGQSLHGTVRISGSKNATLPIFSASLLTDEPCLLYNVPALQDVFYMKDTLKILGTEIQESNHSALLKTGTISNTEIPEYFSKKMRASILMLGPLLAREGKAKISYPGGCCIGARPINYHLDGLAHLGVEFTEKNNFICGEAEELKGAECNLAFPSVGATENIMMAASLAKGKTIIRNAAREPEIVDLQNFLNGMGGRVKGAGSEKITIEGVEKLGGANHTIIPDRIEAGTFMVAGAMTEGDIIVSDIIPEHLVEIIDKLTETGAEVDIYENSLRVIGKSEIKPIEIETAPYPGFPTDMQPQMAALASIAKGTSIIKENVFESRQNHFNELVKMGAQIQFTSTQASIDGIEHLYGNAVIATDLRAGAALMVAGLSADGITEISGIHHIERGYERIDEKLTGLGGEVTLISERKAVV